MFSRPVSVLSCFLWVVLLDVSVVGAAPYCLDGVHTGVNSTSGARPARRNILDFQSDLPAWSLYIQGLVAIQQTPENKMLSWFQIAGIHGRPYYAWDNATGDSTCPETGYCPHYNVLFPTWHRGYVGLFEQVLAYHVQAIAKNYNSTTYQTAADNFRVPYWDWASIPTMPDVVNEVEVEINTPVGLKNISNPLLLYKFQQFPLNETWFPPGQENEGVIVTYSTTLRAPNDCISDPSVINANLGGSSLMQYTYLQFQCTTYNNVATSRSSPTALEYTHNLVHHAVGGYNPSQVGHMFTPAYAAFDPIFWLHHANVDRLLTLWMAMHPDSWMEMAADEDGSFTNPAGGNVSSTTPLTPFWKEGGGIWNSNDLRDVAVLGYSYPEVRDWEPKYKGNKTSLAESVRKVVEKLYNPGGKFTGGLGEGVVLKLYRGNGF